jgi:opacity protein-like surface antigen
MLTITKSLIIVGLSTVLMPIAASAAMFDAPSQPQTSDGVYIHQGIYTSFFAGAAITPSFNIDNYKFEYRSDSWQLGGSFGYQYGSYRFEGEIVYMRSRLKRISEKAGNEVIMNIPGNVPPARVNGANGVTSKLKGDTEFTGAFFNVIYNFDRAFSESSYVPYAGLGLGYGRIESNAQVTLSDPTATLTTEVPVFDGSSNEIAFQPIIGIAMNIGSFTTMTLDYRYVISGKLKATEQRYKNHTFNVSLIYRFDEPAGGDNL